MNLPETRIRLLHSAAPGAAEPFRCEEIALGTPGGPRATLVDLLVIDARNMAPEALRRALRQAAEWNGAGVFRRGVLVAPKPDLESVVLSIRAGLHEVVPAGIGALHLVRLLCGHGANPALRRERQHRLLQLLRLGRPAWRRGARTPEQDQAAHLADEQRTQFERELAEREATLLQREQDLRATANRVQADLDRAQQACAMIELAGEMRAELEKRENELRLMARQTAAAQPTELAAAPDQAPIILRREMESLVATQQLSLDRRERALATRERWLRDYEQALTGRLVTSEVN